MASVTVRLSETYDLHTQVGKIGLIGIHTPSGDMINKFYGGLYSNFAYIHMDKCDVEMACASIQSADPLQIGVSEGQINPKDMFNPILSTAVSNDSMSLLMERIYSNPAQSVPSLSGDSVVYVENAVDYTNAEGQEVSRNAYSIYYGLVAEGKYKTSYAQAGVSLRNLVPIVHPLATSRMINHVNSEDNAGIISNSSEVNANGVSAGNGRTNEIMSLPPVRMPSFPTYTTDATSLTKVKNTNYVPVYVGAIITPPAYTNLFYYRMTVTWTITFSGLVSTMSVGGFPTMESLGNASYHTDYPAQSTSMTAMSDLVDTGDMELEKAFTKVY